VADEKEHQRHEDAFLQGDEVLVTGHAGKGASGATVHLPYDICISLLSNAESIYILFIVNAMNVAFKSNVTGRH
jgi:hypothetical protein